MSYTRLLLLVALVAAGCGDDAGSTVTLRGSVTGLAGTGLVLENGGLELPITSNGDFVFETALAQGATYAVTVKTQPTNPAQLCTVANGSGTISGDEITPIAVTCETAAFGIRGTVTGLAGTGLVLQNNGGDDLAISADGEFAFVTPVTSGATYDVTVHMQPNTPAQTCTVSAGTGTVGNADVTDVAVTCSTNAYTIGGTVMGLVGTGLTLRNNGSDDLAVLADGTFTFETPVASGETFEVTVLAQPTGPSQTCTVTGGTGTVVGGDVTSVAVNCMTNRYTVGGTVDGLAGTGLTLRNGADEITIAANGTFAFPTPVESGATYEVTAVAQPASPSQTCVVTNGTGTVGGANITDVVVSCTTNQYTVGGTLSGLSGPIVLHNNGGDALTRTANGSFTFATPVASGEPYAVTVAMAPAGQSCFVTNGAGTVTNANITTVQVTCATNTGTPVWPSTLFPLAVPDTTYGLGDLAFAPNGDLLASVSSSTTSGRIVRVSRTDGTITTVATIPHRHALAVAYRAANDLIYTLDGAGALYTITSSGTVTSVANLGANTNALAIAPASFGAYAGYIIAVGQEGSVRAIHPTTHALTTIASGLGMLSDLEFASDGTLYVVGATLVRTVTAAGVVATFATGFGSADGITVTPNNSRMYITDSSSDQVIQILLPSLTRSVVGSYDIDDGFFVGGILADGGNTVIVMTGESSTTLRAFTY